MAAFHPGSRVGPYQIVSLLGAGGMGQVYRARDTRLERDVAIKFLPDEFAKDADRLSRFQREAQVIASLNHPNIAAIHELEESDGMKCLVLELVEGETIQDRLKRGAIPADEALQIAMQIAEALEAAHEKGVAHRDLKPANVKITPDGKVKVLDFGLAKLVAGEAPSAAISNSPTLVSGTAGGVILGTAAYMSPEQARGKTVDRRTDIWAYGCVLYEMLTARQAFSGETVSDTIAAILAKDLDFDLLPQGIPRHLKRVLRRCLERNPARRWQHIGDVRVELLDTAALEGAAALATPAPRRRVPLGIACGLLALAVGAESILLWRQLAPEEARPLTRFTIASPAGVVPDVGRLISISSTVAISADGKRIVFVGYATGGGGLARLYTRSMDSIEVKPIPGSESATGPFLSPDGEWVAFIAGGKLRKVALSGGVPLVLSETATAFLSGGGGKWLSDGTIIFSVNDELLRISAAGGGTPEVITKRNPNEGQHVWPEVLPGEDAVLFAVRVQGTSNQIAVQSLRTGERKILVQDGAKPRYSPTGHVLYARSGSLMALPFDKNKLEPTGPPFTVLDDLDTDGRVGLGHYDVSNTGTLIYLKGIGGVINSRNQLVWVDRQGKQQPLPLAPRLFEQPRLSPDGTQAAFRVTDVNIDVWIHNLVRGSITRLTFHSEEDETPIWAPDGKLVAFVGSGKSQTVHSYEAARRERERTADRRADGFRALEFLVPRRQNNRIHALRSHDSR